ncbi:MAG: DUF4276 family protein [Gammaproteobacteria bacterium]|nr:DUF4276 family protein [Gammaproteobacteria bacterium]
MSRARVYVEGGGSRRELQAKCRRGFRTFLSKTVSPVQVPDIVSCGGRGTAYNRFCSAWRQASDHELLILLVDSEGPVSEGFGAWTHLSNHDNWAKPAGATDDNAHLMVQCMEAWFLADKNALAGYFGPGFATNALPPRPNIEQVPKTDIEAGLKDATRATGKGRYNKGRDSYAILGELDPELVASASAHAQRLLRTLGTHVSE